MYASVNRVQAAAWALSCWPNYQHIRYYSHEWAGFFLLAPEMEQEDHQASQEHIGDSGELHGGQPGLPGGGGGRSRLAWAL